MDIRDSDVRTVSRQNSPRADYHYRQASYHGATRPLRRETTVIWIGALGVRGIRAFGPECGVPLIGFPCLAWDTRIVITPGCCAGVPSSRETAPTFPGGCSGNTPLAGQLRTIPSGGGEWPNTHGGTAQECAPLRDFALPWRTPRGPAVQSEIYLLSCIF